MRSLYELNRYRCRDDWVMRAYGGFGDDKFGAFWLDDGLFVIAANGGGWDHVSVSFGAESVRCPTWEEMEQVKRLFFHPDETVMQLHVPATDHISYHPYCLHLWRPHEPVKIPRPPQWMVGPSAAKREEATP